MDAFSPIEALKGFGASATSGQVAGSNLQSIQKQLALIKRSDTLSDTERTSRSSLIQARASNDNSAAALRTLTDKLNVLRASAQGIRGGAGFIGFRFKTSDATVATGDAAKGTQVGNFQLSVDQLATATTKASGTININGTDVAFQSDQIGSNTVTNAGGIQGLTLNLLKTTPTVTSTSTTFGFLANIEEADRNNNKLELKDAEHGGNDQHGNGQSNTSFKTGDEVQVTGVAGLDPNKTFFVNKVGNGSEDIRLFDTKEHALAGGSTGRIDITANGDLSNATLNSVTRTTTTSKQTVTISVGRSKEDAIEAASNFFKAAADVLNFVDTATAQGGALAGDRTVGGVTTGLRQALQAGFSAFGSAVKTKGNSNAVNLDVNELGNSLDTNFAAVENVFRNGNGISSKVESFAAPLVRGGGIFDARTAGLTRESNSIDKQLGDLQATADQRKAKLTDSLSSIAGSILTVSRQSNFVSKLGQDKTTSTANRTTTASTSATLTGIDPKVLAAIRQRFGTSTIAK